jgi:hypothetical protein
MSEEANTIPFWARSAPEGEHAIENLDWAIRESKRQMENAIERAMIAVWHLNVPAENTIMLIAGLRQQIGVLEHLRARSVKIVEQLKAEAA